ncbi:MAG: glycoside hydrolase family 97 catalytic domain-containing protein, partial [Cyclobacteriaceae bacterium]|nr:glycoside hydrolase family 97 catalytic domain-containing protein [Cyclobacteriaceae bacterium]
MKRLLFFIVFLGTIFCTINSLAQTYLLNSPDDQVQFVLHAGEKIQFEVLYQGQEILARSGFELTFEQAPDFGRNVSVIDVENTSHEATWKPVAGQFKEVLNHYNQMSVKFREIRYPRREIGFTVRAYNDGVAFRYSIPESWKRFIPSGEQRDWVVLLEERTEFSFMNDHTAWVADYGSYATHQESEFNARLISEIPASAVAGLPLLVQVNQKMYLAITEADLTDWAGMYLRKKTATGNDKGFSLVSDLSPLPEGAGRVNVIPGMDSPWRVMMIGNSPGKLIESQLIYNLNDPCAIADPSWIKPGISAWDHWWSGEVKMETRTLREYIQLASDMGWEYMLIDWHWYGPPFITEGEWRANPEADITSVNPAVDMPQLIEFARNKNVKLILWLLWDHVDKQMEQAFPLYEKWGIAGVKIDFMARDDQEMVKWYHKVVKKAANHHLVVDYHGAYKPTGWSRTYPNLLTREGVLGNEYSKWSFRITPEHNVTLPFTRMLAGHMDYTPGAFINVTPEDFKTGVPARVMNTRAHQLAMFVVYFSPYTVACDHPDNYKKQPGIE